MKTILITLGVILPLVLLFSFQSNKQKTTTVAFTSDNATTVINNINKWSTYGYTVKFIVNQTVDISESRKFNNSAWDNVHVSKSKGNIIVIMELTQ